MVARLIVNKDTGELLFDTTKICYGLVKSGNFAYLETWPRKYLRSSNLDPNDGSSWSDSFREGDRMYGFSIANAQSPISFISGKGVLQGTIRTGNTVTFLYGGGDENTKYYCFDLMGNNIAGSPYLKTYTDTGVITFNSLQPPLNIVGTVQAPGPGALDAYGRYPSPYSGGAWQLIRAQNASVDSQAQFIVNIQLGAGIQYAVFLPWSRSASGWLASELTGVGGTNYGFAEGAYGRTGGISFMFAPAGATAESFLTGVGYTVPGSVQNLPVDRFPQALLIDTATLPFPYN
ncbi:hypothetical protein BK666_21030 [Pseudomonas frederiksbergensis]|uniref:Uncharacterized protein n=2 Tax=Pseudomonas frederiksbergensis TaxID=104087 RepID=A0A423JZZ3_9PSED|nr:hypothetical protein BK666_21030 [Pseudomonas frederiksbergensis]